MSIKLPSALTVAGVVVDSLAAPVTGFKVRAKLLAPDGAAVIQVNDEAAKPLETTTAADGSFSLTIKDSQALKLLITQGYALLFKSSADDSSDTPEAGLSRSTPLHLNARQRVTVRLEFQPKQAGDATKPSVSPRLTVLSVSRDGKSQPSPLTIHGLVLGPQGAPVGDLSLSASLVVPGTGQIVELPQSTERPSGATTTKEGRFQITIERAGELLPFQPYSAYGIRLSARPAHEPERSAIRKIPFADACHLNPAETSLVKLRWDATDPTKPTLTIDCVHRSGAPCPPAEGMLQALGQLLDNATSKPLRDQRVQVRAGAASKPMGEVRTNAQGYFPLPHPWPLALATPDVSLQWKLSLIDANGNSIAPDISLSQDGLIDNALPVKVVLTTPGDASPTLAKLLAELKKTIDSKTQAALDGAKIKTLKDVLKAGSLRDIKGAEKADAPTLLQLEQAADLWSVVPTTVSADAAVKYLSVWLSKGHLGTADLGSLPRAAGTAALKAQLGDAGAAQAHAVASARSNLLNFLHLGTRLDTRRTTARTGSLLDEPEPSCSCEECQTTVSPNAYLADLIRYAYFRVQLEQPDTSFEPLTVEELQAQFFQPFADLPMSCASMTQPILTIRIAIEVLRGYMDTLTLNSGQEADLIAEEAAYRKSAYGALLAALNVTSSQLRLASGDSAKLAALADQLGLVSGAQVEDLLLTDLDLVDESVIESRFGLRDSTRAALDDPTPPPDLLAWRLSRLQIEWSRQDAPSLFAFPTPVPILDPDVLHFGNLRLGWDSTHATTTLWQDRREAIDAQLSALRESRALAVGDAVMDVTQPLVTMPTSDEKWAAWLTVSLSDDEVLSMAATLSLDDQDEARELAAEQKVLVAKVARGGTGPLSTAEQATIDAILIYTGTGMNQAAQDASQAWMEAQYTTLTPTSGTPISTFSVWHEFQRVLKGTPSGPTPTLATVTAELARFNFAIDAFLRAFDLYTKLVNQGFRTVSGDEWAEFDAIFVARWKLGQFESWYDEEDAIDLQVTGQLFWLAPEQLPQPKWLGSPERYQKWLAALQSALGSPIINPTLLRPSAFLDISSSDPESPYNLLLSRGTWFLGAGAAMVAAQALVEAASAMTKLSVFDDKVLATSLLIPKVDSSAHSWYEPGELQKAFEQGSMTGARLEQLLLDRSSFQEIFRLRGLIDAGSATTLDDWRPVMFGLLKAQLRREYGGWRIQEEALGLSLSPAYFQLPPVRPLEFPPQPNPDDQPALADMFTAVDVQTWRSILRARIAEQERLKQEHAELIEGVEQKVLPRLREALVTISAAAAGFDPANPVELLSDRLLMDFLDSPASKTTRLANAIATLQSILSGLRRGDLFRFRTDDIAELYPVLQLEAEHFDGEWQWMGSYGSWRSALFIFMYPENLLYPTLRQAGEQSLPFTDLTRALREGALLTPENAQQRVAPYAEYFSDVCNLTVAAACRVNVPFNNDVAPNAALTTGSLLFMFATTPGGRRAYWARRDPDFSEASRQSLWNPIPVWSRVVRIYGAVPFTTETERHYIVLIAQIDNDDNRFSLEVLKLDLDRLEEGNAAWDTEPNELTDWPISDIIPPPTPEIAVEQVVAVGGFRRPPHIYVGIWMEPNPGDSSRLDVYRMPLNGDSSNWGSQTWTSYLCREAANIYNILFGFSTSIESPGNPTYGFNFISQAYPTTTQRLLFSSAVPGSSLVLDYYSPGLGNFAGVLQISATANVILGTAGSIYWQDMGSYGNMYPIYHSSTSRYLVPLSSEVEMANVGLTWFAPIVYNTGTSTPHSYGSMAINLTSAPSSFGLTLTSLSKVVLSSVTLPPALRPAYVGEDLSILRSSSLDTADNNNVPSLLLQLYEALFAVPMHIGLQLTQARYYQAALDWYRKIFDYTRWQRIIEPGIGDLRKVYFGLLHEEDGPSDDYLRTAEWMADPFNPHAIAAMRPNSYTRFTLISLVQCLLDYADSEFAADTAESVPRARALYLDALKLLEEPEVMPPPDCAEIVAEMDFSFVPSDWLGTLELLLMSLGEALGTLPPEAGSTLKSAVLAALKDSSIPKWGDRFTKAKATIKSALAAAPKPPKLRELFASDRSARRQAQLALLARPAVAALDEALKSQVRRRFSLALAELTGVRAESLRTDPTLKLDWLSQSHQKRRPSHDPAKRSPVLVQPEDVISQRFKDRWRWDPLAPNAAGLAGQKMAAEPALTLAEGDPPALMYMPGSPVTFCVPPNPIPAALRARGLLNLYKLRSGRNISGFQRQVDFYASPTDAQTGLPTLSANGGLSVPNLNRLDPTEFRYPILIERARRQVQLAAQFEGQLLQSLEKSDNARETMLRARNDLATQRATLNLKSLETQDAQLGVSLTQVQQQRNLQVQAYYQNLLNEGLSELERAALDMLALSSVFQTVAVAFNLSAAAANIATSTFNAGGSQSSLAAAASSGAGVFSTLSQILSMQASFDRRRQEWQQQKNLTYFDGQALDIQFQQANIHVQIKQEEANLVTQQVAQAEAVVDFLATKFTNVELYEWMSRILQGLYSAQLQQATATARLAQQQLRFDLLEGIDVVQTDYWSVPLENTLPGGTSVSNTPDRKGLTGAERLQRDLERLDGIAQDQTTRLLQLTRTISLATVAPGDFQRLKETGEMWFETREADFDREFPGHYFRRINKVKISLLALVPPTIGIRATLSNVGPSRVTVPSPAGFVEKGLPPSNDTVSFTSPQNASGLFDLDIQSELRRPFEGVGVDTLWHFELPMPANPIDYSSIADVQITIEYTARFSPDYLVELRSDPNKIKPTVEAVRVFSFRHELVDAWYALHNPPPGPENLRGSFSVSAADFPANVRNLRAQRLTLYMSIAPNSDGSLVDLSKDPASNKFGLAFGTNAVPAIQNIDPDSMIVSSGGDNWIDQLPGNAQPPFGTFTLSLPASQQILDLLRADQIRDILFAISYVAYLPDWPSGVRPKKPF